MATCILCNSKAVINEQEYASRKIYNCPLCGMFVMSDLVENQARANAYKLAAFLMSRKLRDINDVLFISFENSSEEKGYVLLTIEEILEQFPQDFTARLDQSLLNLAGRSAYPGDEIIVDRLEQAPWFYVERRGMEPMVFMIEALRECGWITTASYTSAGFSTGIILTAKGWQHVDQIRRGEGNSEQVLVCAPMFEANDPFWQSVRKACRANGYQVVVPKRPEGAAPIAPALIAQTRAARLVICELSGKDAEAYYAAGMARAYGGREILTCQEKKRRSLAVDSDLMSVLFWDTPEALCEKLTSMIKAMG